MRPSSSTTNSVALTITDAKGDTLRITFDDENQLWTFVDLIDKRKFAIERHTHTILKVSPP